MLNSLLKNVLLTMDCFIHTMNFSAGMVLMLVYTGLTLPLTTLNLRTVWRHSLFLNLFPLMRQKVGRHQKHRQQVADRHAQLHNHRTPRPLIPHRNRNNLLLNRCQQILRQQPVFCVPAFPVIICPTTNAAHTRPVLHNLRHAV